MKKYQQDSREFGFGTDICHLTDGISKRQQNKHVKKVKSEKDKSQALKEKEFIFTDPASRKFELSQFAMDIIDYRIRKAELLGVSGIYTIKEKYANKVADRLLWEESDRGKLYSKSEAKKRIHTFINIRIRTWFDLRLKFDLKAGVDSPESIIVKDEKGDTVDFCSIYQDDDYSEDQKNPIHRNPLEIMLAKEKDIVHEKALKAMAAKRTLRSREHLAIVAMTLDRPELADYTILKDFTNTERNVLKFHAIKKLCAIVQRLYPVEAKRETTHAKIKKTPFKILKEIYRKKPALWDEECNLPEAT
jgi:hypothetical protein